MPLLHAIVLGLTQGLSEFLPISSSGHLILVPWLFHWTELTRDPHLNKTFDVALHLGTLVATLVYFRREVWDLGTAGLRSIVRRRTETPEERLAWLLLMSAVPGAIAGALFEKVIEDKLGAEWLIGLMLVMFGIVLYFADRLAGDKDPSAYRGRDAVLLGAAQMLALQPGVSRSGITMTAARTRGFTRDAAARLSFLMALPITAGAVLYKAVKLVVNGGLETDLIPPFVWGTVVSAISGYVAVVFLLRLVRTRTFLPFTVYRIVIGAGVLIVAATSWR